MVVEPLSYKGLQRGLLVFVHHHPVVRGIGVHLNL
jgi:hypothetical protein